VVSIWYHEQQRSRHDGAAAATNANAFQHTISKDDVDRNLSCSVAAVLVLLVFSVLYTVLYGAYFGWGPMQLLFKDHGFFLGNVLTRRTPTTSLSGTNRRLANVNMVGQLAQITSPLLGYIADHYRAGLTMALTCWLSRPWWQPRTGVDQLLYIAFACLGMTTWMVDY
jgi:hypothetical protein